MTADERASILVLTTEVRGMRRDLGALDNKVDVITTKIDKAEGVVALLRWLGFGGFITLLGALILLSQNVHPS